MQYFYTQIEYNFKIKMVTIFWMHLNFSRSVPSSLTFAETFLYEKEACSYIDKVYFTAVHKKKQHFYQLHFKYRSFQANCFSHFSS